MVFNSFTFFIFFACVLGVHYSLLSWRMKKLNLLLASYLFYAAWNPPFVILLWISTLVDWIIAKRIHNTTSRPGRNTLLISSLCINLGLLGTFKYSGFLLENFTAWMALLGVHFNPARLDIILPVGISFYTFQTLSYTLDIYMGKARPWHSFLDYAMFVTFFPQLVAGPIVRANDFLPQCHEPSSASGKQFAWGMSLIVLGLFEKVVLADGLLAPAVEAVYDAASPPDLISAWSGTVAFAGQIFCDFAGYSTCAIGAAMCLGFSLPNNFRFPYAAIGFSDFWRRWHISLSTWLRDYLYIPMGGNRKGTLRTYVNLSMTMLIGGLWHGASWTFVAWGALHGAYLMGERALPDEFRRLRLWSQPLIRVALGLATFVLVCFAWVFFRADTFSRAFSIVTAMLGSVSGAAQVLLPNVEMCVASGTVAAILIVHGLIRNSSLEAVVQRCPWWARSAALAGMLVAITTMPGEDRAFIYFQF